MRYHTPQFEAQFFDLVADYINLEANTGRKYTESEYNLTGVRALAERLDHPQRGLKIIHVAGTKGKGSTTAMLAALLHHAGESVGAFTSPHLASIRERFAINGQPIGYDELLDATKKLKHIVETAGMTPTFFEFITVLALAVFRDHDCRWAVLETGIGGLLDCTNFIENPACSVITAVSFDHTELLGKTIREIAEQKAGIIKPGRPVVVAAQPFAETLAVVESVAHTKNAPIHIADLANLKSLPYIPSEPFQQENLATALTVCKVLDIPIPMDNTFNVPRLPGRCECVHENPLVILDAAHNADSARRLAEALKTRYPGIKFISIVGITAGKDAEGILKELRGTTQRFILTDPRPFKASGLEILIRAAQRLGVDYELKSPIESIADLPKNRPLLFTGSFFTAVIGEDLFNSPT